MIAGIIGFFKQCWSEIHNITWPTKKNATHSIIVICVTMVLVGLFLAFFDGLFSRTIEYLFSLK